jgi:oligoendopeptidase F
MTAASSPGTLPRWDVSDVHPSLSSRQFMTAHEALESEITRLVALYDGHAVGAMAPRPPTAEDVTAVEEVIDATNGVQDAFRTLHAYVASHVTTDSRDDGAQGVYSQLLAASAILRALGARLAAWVAALGPDALAAASPVARDHAFALARAAQRAEHQMSGEEESLYSALSVTGSTAWQRLHHDVTSQLTVKIGDETLPMAAARGRATHPDPTVRQAAFEAEQAAWPTVAIPLAAAMNAIKGEAVVVDRRRGWVDPLDASRFANAVDRQTFDAMQGAVDGALPDFRRWLRTKARLHGHDDGLPWCDLFAPLATTARSVSWDEGCTTVAAAFASYSAPLARLVERAVGERWIDAEPRIGKRDGAFCASLAGDRSLVFLNWSASFDSVQTLAHELGHAYHNTQLAARTALQRQLPMALAETASIFCETLVVEAGLAAASAPERLGLLDTDLQGATQVVVDIRSRLVFEAEVFRRRAGRTLSVPELCEVMTAAQHEAYADALAEGSHHPWMWAVKGHYYSAHFYNWPYTFGLLFGIGLFARYRLDPERFRLGYDNLLSSVGLADAATLGAAFGIDVHDEAFWTASLDVLRARMAEYARLAQAVAPLASE